jgi:lysophospholipase L1-like esterase
MNKIILFLCMPFILLLTQCTSTIPAPGNVPAPEWVSSMRAVHAEFKGEEGYVAQFGDSMTYTMAFWNPMSWSDPAKYLTVNDGLPLRPNGKRWSDVILGTRDKGPEYGNFSGWTSDQVRAAVDNFLTARKPEIAIILVGSNDIRTGDLPINYRTNLEAIVDTCLAAHCIPILNTIPPFRGKSTAVGAVNRIIRETAYSKKVPLADYHAACLKYRPGNSWDGTLISRDGVHPTAGMPHDFSEENLMNSGYALRNWVNFLAYREIYFRVLASQEL